MSRGDLRFYEPGREVDVEVVANSDGEVAGRGDIVDVVGEENGRTQVEKRNTADGTTAGHLKRIPTDYDEDDDYTEGDSAGTSAVFVDGPIDWFEEADAEDLEPADHVVLNADGYLEEFDESEDDDRDIFGYVWATGTRSTAATAEKVAVVRRK